MKEGQNLKAIDGTKMENVHFRWSPEIAPVQSVAPGEEFHVIIPDSSTMQIRPEYTREDMHRIDEDKFDGAVGPVYVEGAEPGDAVEVNIREIKTGSWGWSAILKNFGLLKGRFDEELIIWDLRNGFATTRNSFLEGIRIPLRPFLGVVGSAPESGEFGMIPPKYFGGNMDNRLLTAGSSLMLPVSRSGALLSFADPHGAQGDGEVCGTAVETSAEITVLVGLHKGTKLRYPRLISRETFSGSEIVTMGISPDLHEASSTAVLEMIELLGNYGLKPSEAYVLCSVAGNLRISEIVDEPNFVVSMIIPEEIVKSGNP